MRPVTATRTGAWALPSLSPTPSPMRSSSPRQRLGLPRHVGIRRDRTVQGRRDVGSLHRLLPRTWRRASVPRRTRSRPSPAPRPSGSPVPGLAAPSLRTPRVERSGCHGGVRRHEPGLRRSMKLLGRHRPDVLAVEVLELLHVEERGDECTSSSRNRSAISARRADLAVVGRCPAEQRRGSSHRLGQVALGRGSPRGRPSSRRFDSFLRFSFTISGRWANTGRSDRLERLRTSSIAFGVTLGRCSSPRMTWVMPMSTSSTTLARKNIGVPFERASRSPRVARSRSRRRPG